MFIRAGWMIPADNLVRWWNQNFARDYRPDIFSEVIKHGDSGASAIDKYLHRVYTDVEEYDCFTIYVGPPFKQKPFVLIMTHSGLFEVQLEDVRKCGLTPRSARSQRVKILLEGIGFDFERNDVQFYQMPICMI